MNEEQWLAATDPLPMLESLRGKASGRKLWLFAVACCRSFWGRLRERSRAAVEVAERFADGLAGDDEWGAAGRHAAEEASLPHTAHLVPRVTWLDREPASAASYTCRPEAFQAALYTARKGCDGSLVGVLSRRKLRSQCNLLRCIVGSPFRAVNFSAAWQTATVRGLAEAAYSTRTTPAGTLDRTRLAVLADALEEAGCDSNDVLGHLRGPGPHVRGCWVVDLVLGKG
jgi:hypothetical protein